jgi:hypothetical protein
MFEKSIRIRDQRAVSSLPSYQFLLQTFVFWDTRYMICCMSVGTPQAYSGFNISEHFMNPSQLRHFSSFEQKTIS